LQLLLLLLLFLLSSPVEIKKKTNEKRVGPFFFIRAGWAILFFRAKRRDGIVCSWESSLSGWQTTGANVC
jgi:hypothetical protein